ncbi:MAG: MoaD/ThiS family protein [Planctomycetes bacterium]|nr:MoaD/ThiS family protein [Planctomycetota bacterium]
MNISIVVSGRSYDTAESLPDQLTLPEGCSLDEALDELTSRLPEGKALPTTCLLAVSGRHLGTLGNHRQYPLKEGDQLVLVAPVAGG